MKSNANVGTCPALRNAVSFYGNDDFEGKAKQKQ